MPDVDGSGNEPVTIDGQYSRDPDGSIVGFRWTYEATGAFIGSQARMSVVFPVGTTIVRLTVTDNAGATSTDTATITVSPGPPPDPTNLPPVSILGPDQVLVDRDNDGSETPIVDGLASYDPDGQIVRYEMRILEHVGGPTYMTPYLQEIGLPACTTWTFELRVFDNDGASSTDTLRVTVERSATSVSISGPSSVRRGASVTWVVTVRNSSSAPLAGASLALAVGPSNAVRDLSPAGNAALPTIPAGGSVTAQWSARAEAGGTIPQITATLSAGGAVLSTTTVSMAMLP